MSACWQAWWEGLGMAEASGPIPWVKWPQPISTSAFLGPVGKLG